MSELEKDDLNGQCEQMDREFNELERGFPMLTVAGGRALIDWLQAIVEECLGNLETIQNYLTALGVFIPAWMQPILNWLVLHYKGSRDLEAPIVDAQGNTCEQAFASAGEANAECALVAKFMQSKKHPLISKIIENRCLAAYRRAHPGMDMKAIDWNSIIQWIITNGPAILQFIMALIAAFG